MDKKTFKDIDVAGKKVLLRVDFNVPMDESLKITDDTRIMATLPTINYLLHQKAKVIICSHLGRPKGMFNPKYSLAPVARRLSEILGIPVKFASDAIGESANKLISEMADGEIVMLENIRFYPEEEQNDDMFARDLAKLADVFVNDAFGTAHRAHASTAGVANHIPAVAGFLMGGEIRALSKVTGNPEQPFVVILGGAKVSDKIGVITKLIDKASVILIGGAMANTFIVAQGGNIGMSRYEKDKIEVAKNILALAEKKNVKIVLPVDTVVSKEFAPDAKAKTVPSFVVPAEFQGMDIGRKTAKIFKKEIKNAKTIVWNGPMGVYEFKKFQAGTKTIAKAVAKSSAVSVIGGGDSVAAIRELGFADKVTHLSTGGGATLKFLEGSPLPGVDMLEDKE
ncbi:MAG: phosphoglycerate kinase [Clostridia bacterium]|nr:phosphoglycerate kinase [Clostridia bacterium]